MESTRVYLPITEFSNDYINANYIPSERTPFICTQSPPIRTLFEFWLMIWTQNCSVIVALNRLVENKTIKGDRYWPDKEKLKFENITIKLLGILHFPAMDITIRRLLMRYNHSEREIYQLHYEGWPDFGVPENSSAIRELVRYALFYQKQGSVDSPVKVPIVVHCSAGIGRSGSFMAIASIISNPLFNQILYDPTQSKSDSGKLLHLLSNFQIPEMVLSFRKSRHPGIVQTQQQYNFIYTALMDELSHATTFSEGLKKVIMWYSVKINEKERLSQSGPSLKSTRENYLQFLSEQTSNDLKYIFNRGREEKNDMMDMDVYSRECQDLERLFLCKSSPQVIVM